MKSILMVFITLAMSVSFAYTGQKSYSPHKQKATQTLLNIENLKLLKVTYDVDVDGGGVGAHALNAYLPANALIIQDWFYIDEQFVDGGSGTVALSCEDANNIYSAADITGNAVGAVVSGVSTGTAANMKAAIAARCQITATVAGAAQTAGTLTLWILYTIHN